MTRSTWRPRLEALEPSSLLSGLLDPTFSGDGWNTTAFNAWTATPPTAALQPAPPGGVAKILLGGSVLNGAPSAGGNLDFGLTRVFAEGPNAGEVDPSFGTGGRVLTPIGRGDESLGPLLVNPSDGSILAIGTTLVKDNTDPSRKDFAVVVVKYTRDGAVDTRWGSKGSGRAITNVDSRREGVAAAAWLPGGKFLVAGVVTSTAGGDDLMLLQFRADGTLDPTFDGDGKAIRNLGGATKTADAAVGIAVDLNPATGAVRSITVAGSSAVTDANSRLVLAQVDAAGRLVPGFGQGGIATVADNSGWFHGAAGLTTDASGRLLLLGGTALGPYDAGREVTVVAAFRPDGSLDTTGFNPDGPVPGALLFPQVTRASGIVVDAHGRILVSGRTDGVGSYCPEDGAFVPEDDAGLARITADGRLDLTFDDDGVAAIDFFPGQISGEAASAVLLQPDGKIVLAAHSSTDLDNDPCTSGSTPTRFGFARLLNPAPAAPPPPATTRSILTQLAGPAAEGVPVPPWFALRRRTARWRLA